MIHQVDIYGKDKVETAIETMRFFEPKDECGLMHLRFNSDEVFDDEA